MADAIREQHSLLHSQVYGNHLRWKQNRPCFHFTGQTMMVLLKKLGQRKSLLHSFSQ